jgi:hypothetical protein
VKTANQLLVSDRMTSKRQRPGGREDQRARWAAAMPDLAAAVRCGLPEKRNGGDTTAITRRRPWTLLIQLQFNLLPHVEPRGAGSEELTLTRKAGQAHE